MENGTQLGLAIAILVLFIGGGLIALFTASKKEALWMAWRLFLDPLRHLTLAIGIKPNYYSPSTWEVERIGINWAAFGLGSGIIFSLGLHAGIVIGFVWSLIQVVEAF